MTTRSTRLRLRPTFITVKRCAGATFTYGPFWSERARRSWLNNREEMDLGNSDEIVTGRWRSRRSVMCAR